MQLNYRGTKYETNSPEVKLNNSHPTDTTLQYRGNTYETNLPAIAQVEVEAALPVAEAIPSAVVAVFGDRARSLMMNHHRQVKQRQQVMLSRLATSIGLDVNETSKYWNHIQGKVHPSFWATYDRSRVASS